MAEESAAAPVADGSAPPLVAQPGSDEHRRDISMEAFLREWQGGFAAEEDNGLEDFGIGSTETTGFAIAGSQHNRINSFGSDDGGMMQFSGGHRMTNSIDALENNAETMRIDSMESDEALISNGLSSAIHDAARITNWQLVADLSKSDPRAAEYVGPHCWTALHHACSRRCPHADVIDSLLSAYPEALVKTDDRGWTPLHQACRFKAPKEVVRLLLRAYPELGKRAACMRTNCEGRSALWLALRYDAPTGVVDLLLQADPGAVLDEDKEGGSPLTLVWDDYANSFQGKRTLQVLLRNLENEGLDSADDDGARERIATAERNAKQAMTKSAPACKELQSKWKKAINLLKAYFQFPAEDSDSPQTRKWRTLHAVSAIKCHPTLFLLARALYPEQANEVDENDLLPGNVRDALPLPDPQSTCADRRRSSNRNALHFAALSPLSGREGRSVIKTLLKLNPAAATHVDGYGSLPLHLLARNDKRLHWVNDGLRDVYNAYPEASLCRDGFGRTPLHCAASAAGHYSRSSSVTIGSDLSSTEQQEGSELRSVIQNLVRGNGAAASITDNSGRLPLHYIAEKAEEWNADAQAILNAHPVAARTRSGALSHNQLPLHMAASSTDARPSLIMNIVNANPRAASQVDSMGRLPLHLVCDSGRSTWDRGIEAIYAAYTQAIVTPEDNHRRWTVLHTVVASISANRDLIERVLTMNPEAASFADGDGKFPLHIACGTNRQWVEGGIQLIFDANPSAALVEDNDGLLPFQIAAMRRAHSADSDGFDDDSEDGDAEAEDLAVLEIMYNLLNAQPSIIQV